MGKLGSLLDWIGHARVSVVVIVNPFVYIEFAVAYNIC